SAVGGGASSDLHICDTPLTRVDTPAAVGHAPVGIRPRASLPAGGAGGKLREDDRQPRRAAAELVTPAAGPRSRGDTVRRPRLLQALRAGGGPLVAVEQAGPA